MPNRKNLYAMQQSSILISTTLSSNFKGNILSPGNNVGTMFFNIANDVEDKYGQSKGESSSVSCTDPVSF